MNDWDLLKVYVERKSEDAFAELVRRHIDLVYSAALRQVGGDVHLAQDVAQNVFNDLARKAGSLSRRVVLSGWLYTSARYGAAKIVRSEQRRAARERESQVMNEPSNNATQADWEQLQTVLDEAMHDLKEADRNAILLRYFQGCEFKDVAEKIGASTDGARMRVDRALEKLRKNLAKRGVISSSAALAVALGAQSVTAAPAGLASAVASSALGAAATASVATTIFQSMAMTKLQAGVIALGVAALTVPIALQHQTNQQLEQSNRILARQQSEAVAEIGPLKQEVARLNGIVAQKNAAANPSNEIFQLRAEVARLREEAKQGARTRSITAATDGADPVHETLRSLALRADQLKKRFAQSPESQIPEAALLTEKDWLDQASYFDRLETDEDFRRALSGLRGSANLHAGLALLTAMRKFAAANDGMIPSDLSQVQSYLEKPLDPAVIQHFRIVGSGKLDDLSDEKDLLVDTSPIVDAEYETTIRLRREGVMSRSFSSIDDSVEEAAQRYAEANNGILPRTASQLTSFVPANIEAERIEKFLAKIPSNITTLDQFRRAHK